MGVSRFLKEKDSSVQIVGTQPTEGSSIPGIRRWSPEFLPKIFERHRVDRIIDVSEAEAREMTRRLAKEEGILAKKVLEDLHLLNFHLTSESFQE